MKTITNTSSVTDYSGEPPAVIFSNPVVTVINSHVPAPVITRIFYVIPCDCCSCNCCNCCNACNCCELFN